MSGIGGSEFILLCLIGLLILGPERLPRVARQVGSWVGKARQITRGFQRQLEEELDAEKNLGFDPKELQNLNPSKLLTPNDDDTFSPLHDEKDESSTEKEAEAETEAEADTSPGSSDEAAEKPA